MVQTGTADALRTRMAHRVDVRYAGGCRILEFQGLLDPEALAMVRAAAGPGVARLVLRAGTEVDRACLEGLRALAVEIVAESPYLARWLSDCRCTPSIRS